MAIEIPTHVASNFFLNHIDLAEQKGNVFNGRCPVCGDSSKNVRKKRLYMLYSDSRGWGFYCHNGDCEVRHGFIKFVKEYFPYQWDTIKQDIFDSMKTLFASKPKKTSSKKERKDNIYEKSVDETLDRFITECCMPFSGECKQPHLIGTVERAKKYLEERLLPSKLIDSFYFCWSNGGEKDWSGYVNRIIIPFFNKMDNMYYFQARALTNFQEPKYINWDNKDGKIKNKPIYNEYFIDKTKPIIICEGILDSVFVRNGCSTLGVKFSMDFIRGVHRRFGEDVTWVMDNDKDGNVKCKWLFEKGETCFLMPSKHKVKDLNALAVELNQEDLTDIVLNNRRSGFEGMVSLGISLDKSSYGRNAI